MNAAPTTVVYEVWDWMKRLHVGDTVTVIKVETGMPHLKRANISSALCYFERCKFLTKMPHKGPRGALIWQIVRELDDKEMNFMQSRQQGLTRAYSKKACREKIEKALTMNEKLTILSDNLLCLAEIVEEMKEKSDV